jgi:MPBQ/MSBQ methyltransferase
MSGSKTNSRALKFYSDVLGLEHLHYGIWEPQDELTLANLKSAQERYQQAIIDLLPETDSKNPIRVLDVGCGTGELSKILKAKGYEVEGLSPDINHVESYAEKVGQPFYRCVFEDFKPNQTYDVVIMSESCQYIALDKLFPVLTQCLSQDGAWLVVDYFVLDGVSGRMAKSGHTYTDFQRAITGSSMVMDYDRDITEATLKTLDFARSLVERGELALTMLKQRIDQRNWALSKVVNFIMWLARKEVEKLDDNRILIDSDAFRQAKTYRLMRFKRR